jgi:hypothetical protein
VRPDKFPHYTEKYYRLVSADTCASNAGSIVRIVCNVVGGKWAGLFSFFTCVWSHVDGAKRLPTCLPACAEASVGSREVWLEKKVLLPGIPNDRIRQYRRFCLANSKGHAKRLRAGHKRHLD